MDYLALFKNACWHANSMVKHRYLMSCADGRWDGAEKAQRHAELCTFYVAAVRGVADSAHVRRYHESDYQFVHGATQALTDNLDTEIGFPLTGRPDYDRLAPRFFERFHAIAIRALN